MEALQSDRGGEYLSAEFKDFLTDRRIVSQFTVLYTPQQNGVAERRNRILLGMVHSMENSSLPILFWGYAIQNTINILNNVPSKFVLKTGHELWNDRKSNLHNLHI